MSIVTNNTLTQPRVKKCRDNLINYLNKKLRIKCPICKNKEFTTDEYNYFLFNTKDGSLSPITPTQTGFKHRSLIVTKVFCIKCGYIIFFDQYVFEEVGK